uniref:Uncharacterized protein n=1 Tax=Nelumbo nucifera TaxID=4432 RepID=A0A822YW17_NELNU|nr:TPA_asm: hypothetical protein HUJ06_005965 [Nelumbo nucifera]
MSLCIGAGRIFCCSIITGLESQPPLQRRQAFLPSTILYSSFSLSGRNAHMVGARKISSRTGRFDSKNRSGGLTTTIEEDVEQQQEGEVFEGGPGGPDDSNNAVDVDDGYVVPELPGDQPDFWEGSQWDALGFFVQYLWAFGIVSR